MQYSSFVTFVYLFRCLHAISVSMDFKHFKASLGNDSVTDLKQIQVELNMFDLKISSTQLIVYCQDNQ